MSTSEADLTNHPNANNQKVMYQNSLKSQIAKGLVGLATLLAPTMQAHAEEHLKIATFDSGFGGYFTAQAITQVAAKIAQHKDAIFAVEHFGDTANAPYGEKTPEQIAELTTRGVSNLLKRGADKVFIACNTASTQYEAVRENIAKTHPGREDDVISIIDASVTNVKHQLDERLRSKDSVNFAILSTPATLKSAAYPISLAKAYRADLNSSEIIFDGKSASRTSVINTKNGKKINLYQSAPADWVSLIEQGADLKTKEAAVNAGMTRLYSQLPAGVKLDGVGEFCTHYPVFDNNIKLSISQNNKGNNPFYVLQGEVLAQWFTRQMEKKLINRAQPLAEPVSMPSPPITVSGSNGEITKRLARSVFPTSPEPQVIELHEEPLFLNKK